MAKSMNPKGLTHISGPDSARIRPGSGPDRARIPLRGFGRPKNDRVNKPLNATLKGEKEMSKPTFMLDIPAPKVLQIQVASDGKSVWVNTENGCVFRACRIGQLDLQDDREREDSEQPRE